MPRESISSGNHPSNPKKHKGRALLTGVQYKVDRESCIEYLRSLAPLSDDLIKLLQIPDKLFSMDERSYSSDEGKTIAKVAESLVMGFLFPKDFADYGIDISSRGSNVFVTFVDRSRKVIVCADIRNVFVEEGSWGSFESELKSVLSTARAYEAEGEHFNFVVMKDGTSSIIP